MYKKILWSIALAASLAACQNQTEIVPEQEVLNVSEGSFVEVNQEEDITMITMDTKNGIVILTTDNSAVLVDSKEKYPILPSDINPDTKIKAYVSNAMTLSEPPRVNAKVILANLDNEEVYYVLVKEVKQNNGTFTITGQDQEEYDIQKDTYQVVPYKTKNIATLEDITSNTEILIWPQSNYIMILK